MSIQDSLSQTILVQVWRLWAYVDSSQLHNAARRPGRSHRVCQMPNVRGDESLHVRSPLDGGCLQVRQVALSSGTRDRGLTGSDIQTQTQTTAVYGVTHRDGSTASLDGDPHRRRLSDSVPWRYARRAGGSGHVKLAQYPPPLSPDEIGDIL